MKLHSVLITYDRLALSKKALASYLKTVSVPFTLSIVDNCSSDGTQEWIHNLTYGGLIGKHLLDRNYYPGYASNVGWSDAPKDATHLHRMDNDFIFRKGWCEAALEVFAEGDVAQVGLRTDEEEKYASRNVGGNMIVLRELWDKGLRFDERPWTELPRGYGECIYFSVGVKKMGYRWARVKRPCVKPIGVEDPDDPYYQKTWADRRI